MGEHQGVAALVRLRRDAFDWEGSDLDRSLRRGVDGEVRLDRGTRALYATDSSNYREVPIGVIVPRTVDAAIAALAICREHEVPVLPRGAGTSLAGQACNRAVVIDCSRHLTHFEIDDSGLARVEPGVIMQSLRDAARRRGWDFGPDPATHDHCTLGGMLGNNSCGVHSVFSEFYGPGPRTSDHVEELDIVTYDGVRARVRAADERELRRIRALGGRLAAIYERLASLRERCAPLIRARFPDMPRIVSGYNLPGLLPERGFHVGRALVGSEATCALFTGATLRLMRAKPARALAIFGYPDIFAAAAAAPAVRECRPVGCEAFDDVLADRIRRSHRDRRRAMDFLPDGRAWLLVEHGADSLDEARALAHATTRRIAPQHAVVYDDPAVVAALTDLREQALGVDAFMPGARDTYEGWEDSAVHPARLEGYLRDLARLYDQYGLHGSLYGHFGQGCVHTRIDFDLSHAAGVARFAAFTEDAARLVVAHGGSLSGEHGDGQSRADLWNIMFGPELVEALGEFKSIWDPDHRMNPGKMAWPRSRTSDLRLADYDPHPGPIELVHGADGTDFGHAALRCVGVGACRKLDHGTMCPSYMVTLDERHSTRGRAHLLFEMLHGELIEDGWASETVREALDLCLGCKACKVECPTQVDMASYKAEFMAHHYARVGRPRRAHAFGRIHRWLGIARPVAPLANALARTRFAKWLADISPAREIPAIARTSFRAAFRPIARPGGRRAILWPDTFNDAFQPEVLHAAVDVLAAAGFSVEIPRRRLCCGRPQFEYGWLDGARDRARTTLATLGREIDEGVPVVGVEPSCVAAFRDELRALLPGCERAERRREHVHARRAARRLVTAAGRSVPRAVSPALPPARRPRRGARRRPAPRRRPRRARARQRLLRHGRRLRLRARSLRPLRRGRRARAAARRARGSGGDDRHRGLLVPRAAPAARRRPRAPRRAAARRPPRSRAAVISRAPPPRSSSNRAPAGRAPHSIGLALGVPMDRAKRPEIVVVTGGTAGVGRATARRFAASGAHVAVLARDRDRLAATAREIVQLGGRALAIEADVADPAQVAAAAERIEQELGPIDIWINNAMTSVFGRIDQIDPGELRRVTDVTYHGYVWGTQAALRAMRPRGRGTIVQVGSALAYRAIPLQAAYCAAKHAIRAFTDALRSELLHDKLAIDVTMVQLPAINTPQFRWCENKLPVEPRPVPPIFQPELAADAIFFAAHHPRREVFLGGSTIRAILGQKVMPGFLDRYLARRGYEGQATQRPRRERASNLFAPVPGDHGAHGDFELQARNRDLFGRVGTWFGAAGVQVAVAALIAGAVLAGGYVLGRARGESPLGAR